MVLKVIIISIVLLALMMLLFGVKLLFKKDAELPSASCCRSGIDLKENAGCACVPEGGSEN